MEKLTFKEQMIKDIYSGKFNTERIKTYLKLAEEYRVSETTIASIFDKGAEWGIKITAEEVIRLLNVTYKILTKQK